MARLINIDEALRLKLPRHYAKIPRWVVRALERLVCQREMNEVITRLDGVEGVEFARRFAELQDIHYVVRHADRLPDGGRYIFVSNHPLGAFDGISYISVLGQRYPHIKVIVNDLLMYIEALQPVFLPVNTLGRQKRADMAATSAALRDEQTQVLTFPAGFCSRLIDGRIQDIEWKKSVITQAIASERDVIPMHFEGRNSRFFYGLEWLRRKLGMKFNIGLILLPRQMMKTARHQTYTITVGEPIPWQTFTDPARTPAEWAAWLRSQTYALAD